MRTYVLSGGEDIKEGFLDEAPLDLSLTIRLALDRRKRNWSSKCRRDYMQSHRDEGINGCVWRIIVPFTANET